MAAIMMGWRAIRDDRRDPVSGEYMDNMCAQARLALLVAVPILGGASP